MQRKSALLACVSKLVTQLCVSARLSGVVILLLGSVLANAAPIQFQDVSSQAGFGLVTTTYGASWGDVNNDGYPDLFANNHARRNSIYINNGDGTFTDSALSLDATGYWSGSGAWEDTHGGSWADYDNDGDKDLLVSTGNCCDPQFFENDNGKLYYRSVEKGFGNDVDKGGRMPVWFDMDDDGLLETLITSFYPAPLLQQSGDKFNKLPWSKMQCKDNQFANLIDYNTDGHLDIICVHKGGAFAQAAAYDFSSVPFKNDSASMPPIGSVNELITGDFDGDLRTDMILLRGALRPSQVAIFDGNSIEAQFVNDTRSFSFKTAGQISIEIDWNKTFETFSNIWIGANGGHPSSESIVLNPADPTVQGNRPYTERSYPEIYIGYDANTQRWDVRAYSTTWMSLYITIESTELISDLDVVGIKGIEKPLKPAVLKNTPGGFVDVTATSGLNTSMLCVGGVSGDFDNDGDQDIYMVCRGGVENIENRMYENDGAGNFTLVANEGGARSPIGSAVMTRKGTGDNAVTADYDGDGLLDLYVMNGLNMRPHFRNGGPDQLFRNVGDPRNWIQLDLVGTTTNRDAVGAIVYATAGDKTQLREQNGGYHRWSQDHERIHFGLGDDTSVNLEVQWPSGNVENFLNVDSNKIYQITESSGITEVDLGSPPPPPPPGEGPGDECFKPTYSPGAAFGLYLWSDCNGTNQWHLRAAAGGSSTVVRYIGEIVSDKNILSTDPFSFETGDVLDVVDNNTINFKLGMLKAGEDGFDFVLDDNADACLDLSSAPSGTEVKLGSNQVSASAPINLLTLESCDGAPPPPPPPGSCGEPDFDPTTDDGILIYKDCGADNWHIRASSGSGYVRYQGSVVSNDAIQNFGGVSLEPADVVTVGESSITFDLRMSNPWWDGIDFTASCSSDTTFTITSPTGSPVLVGANKDPGPTTFKLNELPLCSP